MLERGTVTTYNGKDSFRKTRNGFISVVRDGQHIGEQVYFHLNKARQLRVAQTGTDGGREVCFSDVKANIKGWGHEPRNGDVIFLEADPVVIDGERSRRVAAWMYEDVWLKFAAMLASSEALKLSATTTA